MRHGHGGKATQAKTSDMDAMALNRTEEIVADLRAGRMVILMDDEDRENEGDLVLAAGHARPEDINFMARFGRGLICLALTRERCERLQLPLMVSETDARRTTNFTVSIEAARGVTTGISAADRATTIRAAVAAEAVPGDLFQPGHIFPLMAQPGGVLTRAGHTEAGVDLVRLAGGEPAAVICEILNDDGSMARMPQLLEFAAEHGLKIGTIADLIQYRLANESTVERAGECRYGTRFGEFRLVAYRDLIDRRTHIALVMGEIRREALTTVRVHVQTGLFERIAEHRDDYPWPIAAAMARIAEEGCGVIVLIDKPAPPDELLKRIRHMQMEALGIEFSWQTRTDEWRTIGTGAQILADLGAGRMRVLASPMKIHSLSGFGLEIVEYDDGA
jgi:3,4-dihydroxy 2-butanone 4-phosphate synthase/GTP cyclohydrolase II